MGVLDLARVVVYRFHEKGLEFFLVNPDLDQDPDAWKIPDGEMHGDISQFTSDRITLDHSNSDAQPAVRTIAIEGDWHDIPSIRGIIKHDVERVKRKIKEVVLIFLLMLLPFIIKRTISHSLDFAHNKFW